MRRAMSFVFAISALAAPAAAQIFPGGDEEGPAAGEIAAYYALTLNPVGAFTDVPHVRPGGQTRAGMRFLYGQIDEEGDLTRRAIGVGADFLMGTATLSLIGGIQHFACPGKEDVGFGTIDYDCRQGYMGGASIDLPLVHSTMGAQGAGLNLGLQMTGGYGVANEVMKVKFDDGSTRSSITVGMNGYSATLGLPLSIVAKSGNFNIVPHLTPRFGWGSADMKIEFSDDPASNEEDTESGTRFMLGGGVGVYFQNGVGLTLGFQKVFIEDGAAAIGLGVTWAR